MIPDDFEKESMLFFAPKHRINGVKPIKKYIGDYSFKYKDSCWICAGWQEATFTFNLGFYCFFIINFIDFFRSS